MKKKKGYKRLRGKLKHKQKRLSPEDKIKIIEMRKAGATYKQILAEVDTTEQNIWKLTRTDSFQKSLNKGKAEECKALIVKASDPNRPNPPPAKYKASPPISLEAFKKERGDKFAKIQRDAMKVMETWIGSLHRLDPTTVTIRDRINAIRELAIATGTMFDKERIQRGQSTENVHVLVEALLDLQKRRANV